jgi:hypothetical protein
MLDTHFPRIYGDLGNADTWPFQVIYKIVHGATASDAVSTKGIADINPFIQGALELESQGVVGITTSCGFLSLAQQQIANRLSVPFVASSLMQIPMLDMLLAPEKRAGVLTIDSRSLTRSHLVAAGAAIDTPVAGTENGKVFTDAILSDLPELDVKACRDDNVEAAQQLVEQHPSVGAIVLECTNMVPYAADIKQTTGLPVFSIYTLVNWLFSGLVPKKFQQADAN